MCLPSAEAEYYVDPKETVKAKPPPKQLDLTDETLKAARKSQLLRSMQGRGRASTFSGAERTFPGATILGAPMYDESSKANRAGF